MGKRVSWEVVQGCSYVYYDTRRQALDHVKHAKEKGHPIELNRWQWVDGETSSRPVDIEALLAREADLSTVPSEQELVEMPADLWAAVAHLFRE